MSPDLIGEAIIALWFDSKTDQKTESLVSGSIQFYFSCAYKHTYLVKSNKYWQRNDTQHSQNNQYQ